MDPSHAPRFTKLPDRLGQSHAIVLDASQPTDVVQTVLILNEVPGPPLVPAALWDLAEPRVEVMQLHQVQEIQGDVLTVVTFEFSQTLPEVGREYAYQQWWLPEAMELVMDTSRHWEKKAYPDTGDHDFCPLTYETIEARGPHAVAYESDGRWITEQAYNKYMRDDFLRVRRMRRQRRE